MIFPDYVQVEKNVYLHVRDWGQGRPVVFIHGWPLSHKMFEYQFIQLPRHGFRCIGITLRGFGKSSQPWCDYSYDLFSDDIKAVLEALELQNVTLVGFGMGGAIALRYMARHAGVGVSKLVLAAAAAPSFTMRPGFSWGFESGAVDRLIELCSTNRPRLNREFGSILFRSETAACPGLSNWFHDMGMEASPQATAACLGLLRDNDLHGDMSSVQVPTVVFHGVHDRVCSLELAEVLTASPELVTAGTMAMAAGGGAATGEAVRFVGIRGARLVRYESSGHALFYEEKNKFNLDLMNFIDDKLFKDRTFISEAAQG